MTNEATSAPSQAPQRTDQRATDQTESPPYGMYVALAALVLISLVAFSAMIIFRSLFETATEVTTVLGSLFAVVGTVVGAYFGIKTSGDTRDKMQGSIDRANESADRAQETANRALAKLDPKTAAEVLRDRNGPQL